MLDASPMAWTIKYNAQATAWSSSNTVLIFTYTGTTMASSGPEAVDEARDKTASRNNCRTVGRSSLYTTAPLVVGEDAARYKLASSSTITDALDVLWFIIVYLSALTRPRFPISGKT